MLHSNTSYANSSTASQLSDEGFFASAQPKGFAPGTASSPGLKAWGFRLRVYNPGDVSGDAEMKAATKIQQGEKIYEGVVDTYQQLIEFGGTGPIVEVMSTNPHDEVVDALEKMVPTFKAPNRNNIPIPALKKALATALKGSGINPDKTVVGEKDVLKIATVKGGKLKFVITQI